jgi:hypothetical protein
VQALGWHIDAWPNGEVVSHGGATGGFQSFAGFDPTRRRGVVVLSNSAYVVEDIGIYVLGGPSPHRYAFPAIEPSSLPPVAIDPLKLPSYVGTYRSGPDLVMKVTVEDGRLKLAPEGRGKRELVPVGLDEFALREDDTLVTFERNVDGKIYGLMFTQGDRSIGAIRDMD